MHTEARLIVPRIPKGKKRMDIYLTEEQETKFKEEVFRRKGMRKGNISEAAQEAVLLWISAGASKSRKTNQA